MFPSGWEWLAVKDVANGDVANGDVANKGLVKSAARECSIAVDQELP